VDSSDLAHEEARRGTWTALIEFAVRVACAAAFWHRKLDHAELFKLDIPRSVTVISFAWLPLARPLL
jgi:hypothetical protein